MDKKRKAAIASAVAVGLMVVFPQMGDTILYVLQTFLGLVPQLNLRPL